MYQAVVAQKPIAFVVWNDGARHSSASLQRLFGGFASFERSEKGLMMSTVSESDYVGLCQVFKNQIDTTRERRAPSLTFVSADSESPSAFARWIEEKGISDLQV